MCFNAASGNAMMQERKTALSPQNMRSFNAASGNAMMQGEFKEFREGIIEFQCRKRQCYDASTNTNGEAKIAYCEKFQCRKRQCYDASASRLLIHSLLFSSFNAASGNAMMQDELQRLRS